MKKAAALVLATLAMLTVTAAPAAASVGVAQPSKLCRIFPFLCMTSQP